MIFIANQSCVFSIQINDKYNFKHVKQPDELIRILLEKKKFAFSNNRQTKRLVFFGCKTKRLVETIC